MSTPESATPPEGAHSPQELKLALNAFKKRLKVTRLDAESSISGGPLSGGRRSDIVAISPPAEFPQDVWDALVKQALDADNDALLRRWQSARLVRRSAANTSIASTTTTPPTPSETFPAAP